MAQHGKSAEFLPPLKHDFFERYLPEDGKIFYEEGRWVVRERSRRTREVWTKREEEEEEAAAGACDATGILRVWSFGVQQVGGLLEIYGKDISKGGHTVISKGGHRYPAVRCSQTQLCPSIRCTRSWCGSVAGEGGESLMRTCMK
jgi:hypothetical protein